MIGSTYLVRSADLTGNYPYYCIKMMRGKAIAEKGLFETTKREIKILFAVSNLPGCCSLVDIM